MSSVLSCDIPYLLVGKTLILPGDIGKTLPSIIGVHKLLKSGLYHIAVPQLWDVRPCSPMNVIPETREKRTVTNAQKHLA